MFLFAIVIVCVRTGLTDAIWYRDLTSPRGLQFGDLFVRLEDKDAENNTLDDRIALRVDYDDLGLSALESKETNEIELDFFINNNENEGRGKKMGRIIIPFLIGAVKASAMTITLGTIKLAALKAFFISKVALVVSIVIIFAKFWKKTEYLEVEELGTQQYPVYDFSGTGYADASNVENYAYMPPSAVAASSLNYAILAPSSNGTSTNTMQMMMDKTQFVPVATKRRDVVKPKPTLLTIKRYSYPSKDPT